MNNNIPVVAQGRTVAPNSMIARVLLAFLATAGIFYVNIIPAIVDGLIEGLSFTAREAGQVASANLYGAATGAFLIVFIVKRIRWRQWAYSLLGMLILVDVLSTLIATPAAMIAIRFAHGCVGGGLVGIGFSVIARTLKPDRTFGVLLLVQFGLGGLGNLYIPRLVPVFGTNVLFASLIAFSVVTLSMLPFLGEYPIRKVRHNSDSESTATVLLIPLMMVLVGIFLFQAGNNGVFAFIIGLGKTSGLSLEFITTTLAVSGWIGIIGALIVIAIHTRFGRTVPLTIAMISTVLATWLLHYSDNGALFLLANCMIGIAWAFVMSYLLGLVSEFDKAGQMAALGGFASKMGLASGPLAGGYLLGENNYMLVINVAIVALILSMAAALIPAKVQDDRSASV
jgi:predicted MFS family arabinose efflux permease